MEQNSSSNRMMSCGKITFLMSMLFVGLLFFFIAITLVYWTYKAYIGAVVFCTLWIDIPGRLGIFLICYYAAGMCGYFPLPERYRLEWFPEPFMLWRYQSWRQLSRNFCQSSPSANLINRRYINTIEGSDSSDSSLFHGEDHFYDCDPIIRRRSAPVQINYPDSYVSYDYISPTETTENVSPNLSETTDEPFMSFDSPICGQIVPMVKGKSSRKRYLSDCSKLAKRMATEMVRSPVTATLNMSNEGAAAKDLVTEAQASEQIRETTTKIRQEKEIEHNPKASKGTGNTLYPRFPWGFLRMRGGIPQIARKIHRRNLNFETRAINRFIREQKQKVQLEKFMELVEARLPGKKEIESIVVRRDSGNSRALSHQLQTDGAPASSTRDIGALTGARPRTKSFTSSENDDYTVNPIREMPSEGARNVTVEGDPVIAEDVGVRTGARPKTGLFTFTENAAANVNPLDGKQRKTARNIEVNSTVNQRRQLPSQRFAPKNRTRSYGENEVAEGNPQKNTAEIQEKGGLNISNISPRTRSKNSAPDMFRSKKLSKLGQKKYTKKTAAEHFERLTRFHLTRMHAIFEEYPQSTKDVPTILEDPHNLDIKTGTQTTEIVNRSIDAPVSPANSSHSETTEKSHHETSFTSSTDS